MTSSAMAPPSTVDSEVEVDTAFLLTPSSSNDLDDKTSATDFVSSMDAWVTSTSTHAQSQSSPRPVVMAAVPLYSKHVDDLISTFNSGIADLVTMFCSSPYLDVVLTGDCCDSLPGAVQVTTDGYVDAVPPRRRALFVHGYARVLHDPTVQSSERQPLPLYATPTDRPGHVDVWMSARTHSLLRMDDRSGVPLADSDGVPLADHGGVSLADCCVVCTDQHGLPKFFLASGRVQRTLHDTHVRCVLLQHQRSLARVGETDVSAATFRCDITRDVDVVSTMAALRWAEWPSEAQAWKYRRRVSKWPTQAIVQEVSSQPVYLVPASTEDSCKSWSFCFASAERVLLRHVTVVQRFVFYALRQLLPIRGACADVLSVNAMRTALLWTLEERESAWWSPGEMVRCVRWVLWRLAAAVDEGVLSHYFMPQCNLMEGVSEPQRHTASEYLSQCLDRPDSVLAPWRNLSCRGGPLVTLGDGGGSVSLQSGVWMSGFCSADGNESTGCSCPPGDAARAGGRVAEHPDLTGLNTAVLCRAVAQSLCRSFDECAQLLYIQLYARTHDDATVDGCIARHKDALTSLDTSGLPSVRVRPLTDRVVNSLASLYYVKAKQQSDFHTAGYYVGKAADLLACSRSVDALLGRVRLAAMSLAERKYEDVVRLLSGDTEDDTTDDTPASRYHAQDRRECAPRTGTVKRKTADNIVASFEDALWERWNDRTYTCCLLVSKVDVRFYPTVMHTNLGLCRVDYLGLSPQPVFMWHTSFVADLLLVLALACRGEAERARLLLDTMQTAAERGQWDGNERRQVAYVNAIAHGHAVLGDRATAFVLLERSAAMMPNARNPAKWMIMSMKLSRVRSTLLGRAGLYVASAVLNAAIDFAQAHLI